MENDCHDNIANRLNEQIRNHDVKVRDKVYLAKYKHGLMGDTILHLADGEDPIQAALAECRRCSGETNLLGQTGADFVVQSVEPII